MSSELHPPGAAVCVSKISLFHKIDGMTRWRRAFKIQRFSNPMTWLSVVTIR